MKISHFDIKGLYGMFALAGEFKPDVNILVGNNGSHKTTLLVILQSMLRSKYLKEYCAIEHAELHMDNPSAVVAYRKMQGTMSDYAEKAKTDKTIVSIMDNLRQSYPKMQADPSISIGVEQFGYGVNEKAATQQEFEAHLSLDSISTFDVKEGKRDASLSLLDEQLDRLQSQYSYYLSDLAKQMTDIISHDGGITKEQLQSINRPKDRMISIVNEAFEKTGKSLLPDRGRLTFRFADGHEITAEALSAGEKQLLIVLLTVLLERERESIVIMDEPEISLHISWQYRLIDWLIQLNPNAQYILTTHSPSIFSDGWGDHIIYMEDITHAASKQ